MYYPFFAALDGYNHRNKLCGHFVYCIIIMLLYLQYRKNRSCHELSRAEVVKRVWAYIKEKDLQNPKDRREIICDVTLEKVLKRKRVTMFQLNKVLAPVSCHISFCEYNVPIVSYYHDGVSYVLCVAYILPCL